MTDHDVLTTWVARLSEALQLPADFELDLDEVLDLARDAAHGVARPAAPVTTFLVGYAAGLQGGGAADVSTAVGVATRLATDAVPEVDAVPGSDAVPESDVNADADVARGSGAGAASDAGTASR